MASISETSSFKFNHTMLRIKDKDASLKFYQDVLGMTLIRSDDYPENKFSLYFLIFDHDGSIAAKSSEEKRHLAFAQEGVLELTHNHGTESDPEFKGYANGNVDPGRGFGHIAISVADVQKACERFERLEVPFKKKPTEGRMSKIAFILDPDGYWIEIVPNRF